MLFIVNGLRSVKESNCEGGCKLGALGCGITVGFLAPFNVGFKFSWSEGFEVGVRRPFPTKAERDNSGTRVVWTGVNPPIVPKGFEPPPQKPDRVLASRGLDGRSLLGLGASKGEGGAGDGAELRAATVAAAETTGRGAGGGSTGAGLACKSDFLRISISCFKAWFSDLVEPSSLRIASIRRSRSATSASRVVMYSATKSFHFVRIYSNVLRANAYPSCGRESCAR